MLACVDVSYGLREATAACLVWKGWSAPVEERELIARVANVAPLCPGSIL